MSTLSVEQATSGDLVFSKLHGTGNDFLFVDARLGLPPSFANIPRPELARKLCHRQFGVGADGLVFVENGSSSDRLKWDFYNNDGSTAEMCGNASRCMGRWAHLKLGHKKITFETRSGLVTTEVVGEDIASHLDYLSLQFRTLDFEYDGKKFKANFVNTGVPHAVVEIDKIASANRDDAFAAAAIRQLRFHPDAGPKGTNVTFLEKRGEDQFATTTFERGVEDFTLSCGTGVLSAAATGLEKSNVEIKKATVESPGGRLKVEFGKSWRGAALQGPAVHVFDGRVPERFLK